MLALTCHCKIDRVHVTHEETHGGHRHREQKTRDTDDWHLKREAVNETGECQSHGPSRGWRTSRTPSSISVRN